MEEYIDVCGPSGNDTRTVKAGQLDLSTATGRMIARQRGVQARYEVERMIERSKRARDQKVERGEYCGGPRPFGCEPDGSTPRTLLCPHCGLTGPDGFTERRHCDDCKAVNQFTPRLSCKAYDATDTLRVTYVCDDCATEVTFLAGSEADAVARCIEGILAGAALGSIQAELLKQGMRTSMSSTDREPFTLNIWSIILRPRNAALVKHCGQIAGRADWMGLTDEATWRSAVAVLEDPSRRLLSTNARKHLGSNLYLCGGCGATLKASSKPKRYGGGTRPVYRCRVKDCVTRDLPALDNFVMLNLMDRLMKEDTRNPAAELIGAEDPVAVWNSPQFDLSRKRSAVDYLLTVTVHPARRGRLPSGSYFGSETVQVAWK
ncbi:recombinase family protein [Streptomyces luteocolor]|uniref:recombinase family protein n=1 Tax=Streptomyces luteocolor TaxID=285500 RepID=UPI00114CB4D6|nr:recombinase family protein [Streptomyces luteocolor]